MKVALMLYMSDWAPLARAVLLAGLYGLLVLGLNVFHGAAFDLELMILVMCGVAMGFVAQEVIDGLQIQRRLKIWGPLDNAMYVYAMGVTWAMPIALGFVNQSESARVLLLTWAIGGVIFGVISWYNPPKKLNPVQLSHGYDVSTPVTGGTGGVWVYYLVPLVAIGVIVALLVQKDIPSDRAIFIWFFLVLTTSQIARYPAKGPVALRPKSYGLAFILLALFIDYASISSTSA